MAKDWLENAVVIAERGDEGECVVGHFFFSFPFSFLPLGLINSKSLFDFDVNAMILLTCRCLSSAVPQQHLKHRSKRDQSPAPADHARGTGYLQE